MKQGLVDMSCAERSQWYVVQTHPRAEGKAAGHLRRQGFATYLPLYLKKRRHARRTDTVGVPLFPRYLFVAVGMTTQRWQAIQSTIGITRLVCNGDRPALLPSSVFQELKGREDASGYVQLERRPQFSPGDKVCVLSGAFQDVFGLYEGMSGNDRVMILLDLLGRKVRANLDSEILVAV